MDVDVLDPDMLLATTATPAQGFDLTGIGPEQSGGCRPQRGNSTLAARTSSEPG
jgi:hypothetical protein